MIHKIGKKGLSFIVQLGQFTFFVRDVSVTAYKMPLIKKLVLDQMFYLGAMSFAVVTITALFIGMAFAVQVLQEFLKFGAGEMIGGVVGLAVWRELAPIMTGVVVAGRVGAALSAELASLKISEQLMAYESLSKNVMQWLIIPRILGVFLMMPFLLIWADVVGVFAGFLVAFLSSQVNSYIYFESMQSMLSMWDFLGGLIKGLIFGAMIGLVGCYFGMTVTGGTSGVGKVTRKCVVVLLLSIFIVNYFLSLILFG